MKSSTKLVMVLILVVLVAIIVWSSLSEAEPGKYDDFARCLADSGAKMYGAYWCPHCQDQKDMFGKSVRYIPYIECDARGDGANPSACEAAGIEGYPTWIFANGERRSEVLPLVELAFRSECELPE